MAITSEAIVLNTVWPYFTLSHMNQLAPPALETTNATLLAFSPVVYEAYKRGWDMYSAQNLQSWMMSESLVANDSAAIPDVHPTQDKDHHYLPVWQMWPPTTDLSMINYDLLSDPSFDRLWHFVFNNQEPILTSLVELTRYFGSKAPNSSGHPLVMLGNTVCLV